MLTRLMLPQLRLHKKALILNVASMAAFGPIPYKTIYPASKAFIYSFSRSLSKELQNTGVKVAVVNPGQIVTNPDVTMRIMHQGMLGKIGLLTAGRIARIAVSSAESGKEVIVPGTMNKINRFLIKWVPEFIRLALMEKTCRKELALHNSF
jgi:short-subunit dehydrogenase